MPQVEEEKNPVLMLNDMRKDCIYEMKDGDDTPERRFIFKLKIDGKTFEGAGPNKKSAKAAAARKALMHPAVNPQANAYKSQQQKKNRQDNRNKQVSSGQTRKPQQNYGSGMQLGKNNKSSKGYDMMHSSMSNSNDVYIDGRKVCPYYLNSLCVKGNQCPFYHPAYSSRLDNAISSERQSYHHRIDGPHPQGFHQIPQSLQHMPQSMQHVSQSLPQMPQSLQQMSQSSHYQQSLHQVPSGDSFVWLQFCQNYLHLRCPRSDCKFLHVSRDDEDVYRSTGRIPAHIIEQAVRKAMVDDIAPAGVTQPCKAYLEGQCNWYSCPFRHVSRQEFSREVVDLLHKEFEIKMRPTNDYRVLASRVLDREPYTLESRRPFDRRDYPFEKENMHSSLSRGDEYLVSGMKSLALDHNISTKQREVDDLRTQLNMLHEENERLRNNMRQRSEDEKMAELKRRELLQEEHRMQERLEKLKMENESLRGLTGNSYLPSQQMITNVGYGTNQYHDTRHEMTRQHPESYSFDALLNTGIMRSAGQRYAQQLLGMPLTTAKKPQNAGHNIGKAKQKNETPKVPVKKSGQLAAQTAARPAYQIKVFGGKKVYVPVNQQKKGKAPQNQGKEKKPIQQGNNKTSNPSIAKPNNNKNENKKNQGTEKKLQNKGNKNESQPVNNSSLENASPKLPKGDANNVIVEGSEELEKSQENNTKMQSSGEVTESEGAVGGDICENTEIEGSSDRPEITTECDGAQKDIGNIEEIEEEEKQEQGTEESKEEKKQELSNEESEVEKKEEQSKEKLEGMQPESDRWVDAAEENF